MTTVTGSQDKSKSLVPTKPLDRIEDLHEVWASLEGKVNRISPLMILDTIPKLHAISFHFVKIDPTVNQRGQGPEVYYDSRFCDKDEVALGGVALQKIAGAAGIQIAKTTRIDDRSEPYYCNMEITVEMLDLDGTWRQETKSKEIDLRDGASKSQKPERDQNGQKTGQMIPLDPSALADARSNIQSLAETKGYYRAVRAILALRQKYRLKDLDKFFVAPKLIRDLDPSDPIQKDALINLVNRRGASLYNTSTRKLSEGGEMRTLIDVTPAPTAMPGSAGVQLPTEPEPASGETNFYEEEDFEAMEFEPQAPIAVCNCSCGCQSEITEEVARITVERCGAPRCKECYPGRNFSYDRHKDLSSLELPKYPGLTAEQIVESVKKVGKS